MPRSRASLAPRGLRRPKKRFNAHKYKGGNDRMCKLSNLSLSALLLALAALFATAQTPSQVPGGQAERDGPGRTFQLKSTRIAAPPSATFTRQTAPLPDDAVFSASPRNARERASIVKVQSGSPFWPQWALNPQHGGQVSVAGQSLNTILATFTFDPLVGQEEGANGGDLLAHFQVPMIDGNDVYMESKAGTYTTGSYSTETWHQNKLTWQGGQLVKVWTFDSDWFAPGSVNDFWEPVYHAVLANGFLYDPGQGGTIFKINKANGSVVKRINPFGNHIDPNTFTASPLSTDGAGNVYYNVIQI